MAKILIVEDDTAISDIENLELKHEGFETIIAGDGEEAISLFEKESPDLIILDLMLPKISGLEVIRHIRRKSSVPVIMVTAKGETYDKIIGLDSGADDYIAKPFEIDELLARIRSVLRRVKDAPQNVHSFKLVNRNLELIPDCMKVTLSGKEISLSKTEFFMLKFFMENQNTVFSRKQIIDAIWGKDYAMDENTIDVYIGYLRSKINQQSKNEYIKTVRGTGYMMTDK